MGKLVLTPDDLATTPEAGLLEFDGIAPQFSVNSTQRGLIPGMQYYRLNSAVTGINSATSQSLLGVGVIVSSQIVYQFKGRYRLTKSAGATSHVLGTGFGGTSTFSTMLYRASLKYNTSASVSLSSASDTFHAHGVGYTNLGLITTSATAMNVVLEIEGTVSIDSPGTIIPQYTLSAAPGGAYTTQPESYFSIWPIGAAGSNTIIGNWA